MGSQLRAEDWEQVVAADLAPHLIPASQPRAARRPADVNDLPHGAHAALAACIGRHGLEDLLIVPAIAWPSGRWRPRCLYSPSSVIGIGEQGAGLRVQALRADGEADSSLRQRRGSGRQLPDPSPAPAGSGDT
jgi:hypothetical protein